MLKTGLADLPLHGGKAPFWLTSRMIKLSDAIFKVLIEEYGSTEILRRIADPFWFQCLSCVLGYDWHSSGTTTVTMGVLKTLFKPEEHGIAIVGGKGARSRTAQVEIEKLSNKFDFDENKIEELKKVSRLTAKVDNAAIQDGFQLYHHTMILDQKSWTVVQQGLDHNSSYARRYHWSSNGLKNYIEEPHTGIASNIKRDHVLDMTSKRSEACRSTSLDLINDNPKHLKRAFNQLKDPAQKTLFEEPTTLNNIPILNMPKWVNWKILDKAYQIKPSNYEQLLLLRGFGSTAIRALALISDLIWGSPPSWEDPVKYSYAHGGKDGVPRPVDKKLMDHSSQMFKTAIDESKIDKKQKLIMLKKLKNFIK